MAFQEFPKMLYHKTLGRIVVPDVETQDARLTEGWVFTQAEADAEPVSAPVDVPEVPESIPVVAETITAEDDGGAKAKAQLAALKAGKK